MKNERYKTVELDEQVLGGGPAQFREVQDHESELFLSYFTDGGVEYLAGGVDSAFNHVERDTYKTRLLHVKGTLCWTAAKSHSSGAYYSGLSLLHLSRATPTTPEIDGILTNIGACETVGI